MAYRMPTICARNSLIVEYVYVKLATPGNFLGCDGKLLRETCEGMLANQQFIKDFANLCNYKNNKSNVSYDNVTLSFQYFLKVFGCVRANDVALKYNSVYSSQGQPSKIQGGNRIAKRWCQKTKGGAKD